MTSQTRSPEAVYALVENGIARHPTHAARVLSLSLLSDPSADEALAWATAYRGLRDLGFPVTDAAVSANGRMPVERGTEGIAATINAPQEGTQ